MFVLFFFISFSIFTHKERKNIKFTENRLFCFWESQKFMVIKKKDKDM